MKTRICAVLCLATSFVTSIALGQQRFNLSVPGTGLVSRAERTDQRLRIEDAEGNATVYQRDPRHDSPDGSFLGFASATARQVIRWPVRDSGQMQIADDSSSPLVFRLSRMEIQPLGPAGNGASTIINDIEPGAAYRLMLPGTSNRSRRLAADGSGTLGMVAAADDDDSQAWRLTPLASGVFRIHNDSQGRRWSLAGQPANSPTLKPTSNSPDQLWQLIPAPGNPEDMLLANLGTGVPHQVLTWSAGSGFSMQPRTWSSGQLWRLARWQRRLPPVFAGYQFISREVQPNPPQPPANVELRNSHSKELWVLLVDRAMANGGQRLKIPPGQSAKVSLERDTGATLVEIYERGNPFGGVSREEFVTPLPPAPRYDLTVYEVIVQSISIDSTVPGGKLDDVQYAPRSLGWFELPPADLLKDGPLDVYEIAKAQQNPGQVRRIDPAQWKSTSPPADPVEELLKKYQR